VFSVASVLKHFRLPLLALALAGLAGCASYHLGTGAAAPGFHSLFIAPVHDTANVPQATALVTAQLREAFLKDGRLSLANSRDEADAVLTVDLAKFSRDTLTEQSNDTGLARKMGLTLDATATLVDHSGKVLFQDRKLTAERQIFTDSGQLLAEYDALPLLAEVLAQKAVGAALDVW
jgi:outer membrane lipopolysaccharide assembly protein LptE/RlpB